MRVKHWSDEKPSAVCHALGYVLIIHTLHAILNGTCNCNIWQITGRNIKAANKRA